MSIVSRVDRRIKTVLLFGPTGVGKTEVIELFSSDPIEVISADSQAVYRYMNVGTAKPSSDLLESVPHHCLSFLDPDEQFNVGEFVKISDHLIGEMARAKTTLITSGDMVRQLRAGRSTKK